MDMAFAKAKSGLYMPSPGGLPGFQRQRMDQTKKAGRTVATFIGFTQFDNNANTDTSISFARPAGGVAAGDGALIYATGNMMSSPTASGGGWTLLDNSVSGGFSNEAIYYKQLTAADAAASTWGVTSTGSGTWTGGNVVVYRPPLALTNVAIIQKTTFAAGNNPRVMTPYTPAPTAWLDLSLILDDKPSNVLETPPDLWTKRLNNNRGGSAATTSAVADATSAWGAGMPINWTVFDPSVAQYVWNIEFS